MLPRIGPPNRLSRSAGHLAPGTVPPPPDFRAARPLLGTWPADCPIIRVASLRRPPTAFNPGTSPPEPRGRFHAFANAQGRVVPVLYGASEADGAIAETVFHDVPVRGAGRMVFASRLVPLALVTLCPVRDLTLVELHGHGLRRLEVAATNLTDTDPTTYPHTVAWARALHEALPQVDGLVWMSRQCNSTRAVVLFGDRVPEAALRVVDGPLPLAVGAGRMAVDAAANAAGIAIE